MARNNPYFKFYTERYADGDISLCSLEAQGLFTNLMRLYWSEEGKVLLHKAKKRFAMASESAWQELIDEKCVKVDEGKIVIKFLDEQLGDRGRMAIKNKEIADARWAKEKGEIKSKTKKKNATDANRTESVYHLKERKGKESREEDSIVPPVLDNSSSVGELVTSGEVKEKTVQIRVEEFKAEVHRTGGTIYTPKLIEEFTNYWTETTRPSPRRPAKLKAELQKTWDTGKRLAYWAGKSRDYAAFLSEAERTMALRKQEFKSSLEPHLKTYGREILNDFYSYWTEKGKDERMRWEAEEFWDVGARLKSWKKRDKAKPAAQQATEPYRIPVPRNQ